MARDPSPDQRKSHQRARCIRPCVASHEAGRSARLADPRPQHRAAAPSPAFPTDACTVRPAGSPRRWVSTTCAEREMSQEMTSHTGHDSDAVRHGDDMALLGELCDLHDERPRSVTDGASEEDRRDRLDALRARIRSGDLSSVERDQLDQLVFGIAVADWRASAAARDFPDEVAVQRALSAGAWSTVAAQLRVMVDQGARRREGDVPPRATGSAWL